jgi:hypothetical protein
MQNSKFAKEHMWTVHSGTYYTFAVLLSIVVEKGNTSRKGQVRADID